MEGGAGAGNRECIGGVGVAAAIGHFGWIAVGVESIGANWE